MPQHTPARPWVTPLIEDALHGATLQDLDHDYARLLEAGSSQEQAAGYVRMQATNEALIAVATDGKDFPIPEWAVDTGDWSILTATSDVVRTHTAYEAKAGDLYACITVEEYAENVDGGTRFAMPEVEVFEGKAFYDLEVLHFAQDLDELARRYEQLVEALGEQR